MSFSPGKDRNFIASLKRTMDFAWYGIDVSGRAKHPDILNNEHLTAVNAGATGITRLIGTDVNDQVVYPLDVAIPLTSAQILALNTSPVPLIAAPGAGLAIFLKQVVIELILTSTAYAAGGAVAPVYHGATTPLTANTLPATVVNGGAGTVVTVLSAGAPANGTTLTANTGVDLYAATANFTTGTGTGKVFVSYSVIVL